MKERLNPIELGNTELEIARSRLKEEIILLEAEYTFLRLLSPAYTPRFIENIIPTSEYFETLAELGEVEALMRRRGLSD